MVCLGKDSGSNEAGKWYNLDDPDINEYLRNNKDLDPEQREGEPDHINYYY